MDVSLFAKTPDQIARILGLEKSFQGKQIYQWLVRGASSFEEMTNLSKALRQELSQRFPAVFSSQVAAVQTDDDGSVKLAVSLFDGSIVECVLLTDREGEQTACLSSQVGCAMGCRFCRTGTLKLKRNLFDYEIVEQFMHLQKAAQGKISHVVFMGMGEPLANLDNVLSAIGFLHDHEGLNLSHRRITVSTCGLVSGINELTKRHVPVKLAVSLVTADDEKRTSLMPVNKAFPLKTLREALVRFQKVSGRRFTFEYCMIHGMNIFDQDADNLQRFCKGLEVIVNLIPFNPCPELPFETPSESEIRHFTSALKARGVDYTIRISKGRSIKGACGQLAGKLEEN
ncbi:MAG: 23S rRNA (adenine(2503)-C(2))-methyltransferase RlmN [Spirochaetales bacterium]|nr:23S rRNA (adenine(2503)-C(2))-methyltransferase RlmN [Spirochaetales bacterium]